MSVKVTAVKATKKTTRKRTPKAVEPEVQPVPEVAEAVVATGAEPATEIEKAPEGNISRVYIGTHAGVQVYEGKQAWPVIREIREIAAGDDTPFICYENGMPVYVARRASALRPMPYPDPGSAADQYGLTAVELYGLTVTFPQTIAKIVEKETQGKPSLLNDAKKIMTLALPIVAAVFAIFLMAVILGG